MAYALVGTAGGLSFASVSPVTPSWGTGETRTAGNLLICWAATNSSASNIATPTGWSLGFSGTSASSLGVAIFYKIAAGSDAAPSVAFLGTECQAQLAEFSGNTATPIDQTGTFIGSGVGTTTASTSVLDVAIGELVVAAGAARYSATATKTTSHTLNNGATANNAGNNDTDSTKLLHVRNAWGVTTSNSLVDSDDFTVTTTKLIEAGVGIVSFKVSGVAAAGHPDHRRRSVKQAVGRASTW